MDSKVISVLLKRTSAAGDYSCADGEIDRCEGLKVLSSVAVNPDGDGGAHGGEDGGGSSSGPGQDSVSQIFPTMPFVEFSLKRDVLPGWHSIPEMLPQKEVESGDSGSKGWGKRASELMETMIDEARDAGLHVEPFFALAALRLADGSHVSPSVPVLMVPNSEAPPVEGDADLSVGKMTMRVAAATCRLTCRITNCKEFSKWKGKVTHVDIFVSDPVALYDRKAEFVGCHRVQTANFTHSLDSTGKNCERMVCDVVLGQAWCPRPVASSSLGLQLSAIREFRHVAEVAIEDVIGCQDSEGFAVEDIGRFQLTADAYVPDYMMLRDVQARGMTEFSGRVSLYDLTMTVAAVPPARCMAAPFSGVADAAERIAAEVEIRRGGETLRSVRSLGEKIEIGEDCFPRWLFFPDEDAICMRIVSGSAAYVVPLRRHPSLRGAYWWCGGFGKATLAEMGVRISGTVLPADAPESLFRDVYRMPSAVWCSLKGNDMAFPDALFMPLDVGRIIYLCRAFRSSGLVATTSPTAYAFTSDGVFLLKEMDDGTLRDAGLICDYVLSDPSTVRREGRVLEFVETGGETVRIEGTSVKTLSGNGGASGSSSSSSAGRSVVVCGEGDGVDGYFVTRPIKLGDGEKLKRIFALEPRGTCAGSKLRLTAYGSADLRRWRPLASRRGSIRGLWGPRIRFVKVRVEGRLSAADTVEALVFRSCT